MVEPSKSLISEYSLGMLRAGEIVFLREEHTYYHQSNIRPLNSFHLL